MVAVVGLKRVLAEGDSWFNLPPLIRPKAIADRLSSNKKVSVKNIARWGDTLAEMLQKSTWPKSRSSIRTGFYSAAAAMICRSASSVAIWC